MPHSIRRTAATTAVVASMLATAACGGGGGIDLGGVLPGSALPTSEPDKPTIPPGDGARPTQPAESPESSPPPPPVPSTEPTTAPPTPTSPPPPPVPSTEPTTAPPTPTPPAKGKYRVTVNGYRVVSETWDHALQVDGKGDEVYLSVGMKVLDKEGKPRVPVSGGNPEAKSATMGDTNGQHGRVAAGSRSRAGGLRSGDSVPTGEPWRLEGDPIADRVPFNAGTVELVEGLDTLVVSPTIWEWDGGADLFRDYVGWFQSTAAKVPTPAAGSTAGIVLEATKIGLGVAMDASDRGILGNAADRPIGIKTQGANGFTFDPQVLTLDHAAAEWLVANDPQGKGMGVVELSFQDDPKYHGHYTLYVQVTKVG